MEERKLNEFIKKNITLYFLANKSAMIPYIDEDFTNRLFENSKMAQDYINAKAEEKGETWKEGIYFIPIKFNEESWNKYVSKVYSAGGNYIECTYNDGRKDQREIKYENVPAYYYNQELSRNISEYFQTKNFVCLKRIRNLKFIIPCKIRPAKTKSGKDTFIFIYAQAYMTETKKAYYFVFTDGLEYEKWERANAKTNKEEWEWHPLLLSSQDITRISMNHGILVNACSWQLTLTPEECGYFLDTNQQTETETKEVEKTKESEDDLE